MKVLASGGILWRKDKGELKVLLIHRTRYDDWSWPKGKVDKGEHISETAVREIHEETGLKVTLGTKLYEIEYELEKNKTKLVHYWAVEITEKALKKQSFKPDEEVGALEWLTVKEAKKKLTYKHDVAPLDALVSLDKSGDLDTTALIILRHAKATPRDEWKKGEASRPLLAAGKEQAKALAGILKAYGPKLVVTSSWRRCMDTVLPFTQKHKVKLVERSQLSEFGAKNGPQRSKKLITNLVVANLPTVICSHRPALPVIVDSLDEYTPKNLKRAIAKITTLKPGSFYVLQIAKNSKGKSRIVSIELVEV